VFGGGTVGTCVYTTANIKGRKRFTCGVVVSSDINRNRNRLLKCIERIFVVIFRQESQINGITSASVYVLVKPELPRQQVHEIREVIL